MLRTGLSICIERMGNRDIFRSEQFEAAGLPMVVRCCHCQMSMALPNCLVDGQDHTWCPECALLVDEAGTPITEKGR